MALPSYLSIFYECEVCSVVGYPACCRIPYDSSASLMTSKVGRRGYRELIGLSYWLIELSGRAWVTYTEGRA